MNMRGATITYGVKRNRAGVARRRMQLLALCAAMAALAWMAAPVRAMTQDDVFRSIQDNVGKDQDNHLLWPMLCAVGGVIILLVLYNQRREREVTHAAMNNPSRLLREVEKKAGLKKNEIRQIRMLAAETPEGDPLLMLVCPSLLANALKQCKNRKLDRRLVLTTVARLRNAHIGMARPGAAKAIDAAASAAARKNAA
jgi:hypothetical protein